MDRTQQAVSIFDKNAEAYQERFMTFDLYHDTFDTFCQYIGKPDASIVDASCGPGNITRYLLDHHPGFNILGTDLSPNMLRLAASNNPTAAFKQMDTRHILLLNSRYDGIICGFGLPYLSKEEALLFIHDAAALLQPKGVLYLSTMEKNYALSGIEKASTGEEVYMYYHESGYLEQALEANGLTVVMVQRKDFPGKDGENIIDLILIAQKQ